MTQPFDGSCAIDAARQVSERVEAYLQGMLAQNPNIKLDTHTLAVSVEQRREKDGRWIQTYYHRLVPHTEVACWPKAAVATDEGEDEA